MDLNEIYKKVGFGNVKENEEESEMEVLSVTETEPEMEVPFVTETGPEMEVPSVTETEPEMKAPSVIETEPKMEVQPVTETKPNVKVTAVTEAESVSDSDEKIEAKESFITEEQMTATLTDVNKPVLDEIATINSSLKDINARVSSLRRLADMHQEIENNLNNQINEYKENLYRRIVNPILVEFFDVQEDMNSEALNATDETAKVLTEYVDMITTIFKHYGVTVETVSVGDVYDTRIHKPVKVIQTDDNTLDRTIAKTRKTLVHSIDGKVIERANVHVYQYQEPAVQSVTEDAEEIPETPVVE